jgi:hypothetical protein
MQFTVLRIKAFYKKAEIGIRNNVLPLGHWVRDFGAHNSALKILIRVTTRKIKA